LELKRGKAPGIDGVTVEEYEANLEENLKNLVKRMKEKRYRPKPARRIYIPKPDGTRRPLGIPSVEDKIVQMGIKKILEAIFEVDFVEESFGFRPNCSPHDALDAVNEAVMTKPVNYVADMDIREFFDTVDHKWLMRCLRQGIADPGFLRLIGRFLKAGVMEEGRYLEVDKGTPQGGVVSPVLANIYLHYILDLWFKRIATKKLKGYVKLVRYCDDKARIIEFGRYAWCKAQRRGGKLDTFGFLGITHYCAKSRTGRFKLGRKTARTKYWQKVKAMNEWLKGVRDVARFKEWWKMLRPKLVGHYRYYGTGGTFHFLYSSHFSYNLSFCSTLFIFIEPAVCGCFSHTELFCYFTVGVSIKTTQFSCSFLFLFCGKSLSRFFYFTQIA
jgi:hypothetical protein